MVRHLEPCETVLSLSREQADIAAGTLEANSRALKAESKASGVDWKMNLVLGMLGTALLLAISSFTWLFSRQQMASDEAIRVAAREAHNAIVDAREDMLRTLRSERDEATSLAVRKTLDEQARIFAARKDPDVVTATRR